MGRELTPNQTIFVREYLINGHNGYQAALTAGYTEESARHSGTILRSPSVKAEMQKQLARFMERYDITEDRVTQELACIAFMDVADFYDDEGNILAIHEMPMNARRAIAGLDIEKLFEGRGSEKELVGHINKFKISSKIDALEKFMRYLKLYPDKELKLKGELNHDHKHAQKVDDVDLDERIKQIVGETLGDVLS